MRNFLGSVCCIVAALVIGALPTVNAAISDDFSDLNDTANPTWTHLDGLVASPPGGETWDASSGQYRMTAPNDGFGNLGFVGSHINESFSDVTVWADMVSFIDGPSQGAPFAVMARSNGNNIFNSLQGYGMAYEPHAAGGLGETLLWRVNGLSIGDLGSQQHTLDPSKDYRFILSVKGNQLHGRIYNLTDGGLVAEHFATDSSFASGSSGLIAYSQQPVPPVDVTWDNFRTSVPEPTSGMFIALGCIGMCLLSRRDRE